MQGLHLVPLYAPRLNYYSCTKTQYEVVVVWTDVLMLDETLLQDFLDDTLSQDSAFHGDPGGVANQPRPPLLDYTNPILGMY